MSQTTTDPADGQKVQDLVGFLHDYYREAVLDLAEHYPNDQRSLYVDYDDLFQFEPSWAEDAESRPRYWRDLLGRALAEFDLPVDRDLSGAHVRLFNLPEAHEVDEVSRSDNIGDLLDVDGQIAKVSTIKPRLVTGVFECLRCGVTTEVPQRGDSYQEPTECQGCERPGPFQLDQSASEWIDHQHARLQKPPERTESGDSATADVHLKDDLVDAISTGDRVTATCRVGLEEPGSDQSRDFDTRLEGEAVRVEESNYDDIDVDEYLDEIRKIANGEYGDPFDLLINTVNTGHHGDETLKLTIALQMFGGWAHHYPDGSRDRGDIHVLMIGEPGCGKSTFLKWVNETAPRSTYASGKGATAAGLTAAATQDNFGDSEWSLEAGALVLADGGVACIDEIDKVDGEALSSLHDALESQQVHVNKAGINQDLNTRAALLAAGNPEDGRFNPNRPKGEQIDLGSALLSRFDLIFLVSDDPDPERDDAVVEHMIGTRRAGARYTREGDEMNDDDAERVQPAIPTDLLRAYIAHARRSCHPVLEADDVEQRIREYMVEFRRGADGAETPIPVTYRHVEAVQRLAEASARVRLDDEVRQEDVERAISLLETSMNQVGIDPDSGEFDADIIETGQSTTQRKRKDAIKQWVRRQDEFSVGDLRSFFEREGIDTTFVQDELEWLKKKGFVWESGEDTFKVS